MSVELHYAYEDPSTDDELVWDDEENSGMGEFEHVTVMRDEVVEAVIATATHGGLVVDATLGGGGHSEAILERRPDLRLVGFDRDPRAIDAATARLARFGDRFRAIRTAFSEGSEALDALTREPLAGLCADLGVSSPQIDDAARGMSFRHSGPLDMRMDTTQGETALELIGRLDADELADIIYRYGEERRSRRIARTIKRAFDEDELATTADLRRAIVRAVGPARVGGVDPATRTFQGLRIAVNREIDELERLLLWATQRLAPGASFAVLSFHSLEDRLVKELFRQPEVWRALTKKPRVASDDEAQRNPRSRSAKLRVARRMPVPEEGEGGEA
jgi:16S rRNA (cytosine1402-N4)-methyltransferase